MSRGLTNDNSGFTLIEKILIVATVAVIGFVGFAIYQASQNMVEFEDPEPAIQNGSQDTEDIPEAPGIEDEEDLEEAKETLEDVDFEEEENANEELESESSGF